jgi:voltage-gated potassium channel
MDASEDQRHEHEKGVNPPLLFSFLLTFCLIIIVLPLLTLPAGRWIKVALLTIIVVLAAIVVTPNNKLRSLAALSIIFSWINTFTEVIYLQYLGEILINTFSAWVVVRFVLQIMKRSRVTLYTLVEALLGYLMLGIIFTSVVAFVDFHVAHAYSINLSNDLERGYFTLITLTTTGYGDITPTAPITKSLSLVIAICGQFYVAVIVAIIVGKFSNQRSS